MTKDEALRLALEALKSCNGLPHWPAFIPVTDAIKAALEAKDEPVVLKFPYSNLFDVVQCPTCNATIYTESTAPQKPALQKSELEKDAVNLLFALHDAWPYVHQHCTIESKKKSIQAIIVKHGEFADLQPPQQEAKDEPVAHSVVAGALFDFMGWLTSREKRLILSSVDEASPAVEAITEFAKKRNLSLKYAEVGYWMEFLSTPPQQEAKDEPVAWRYDQAKYRTNDLRGRQWAFNVFSQARPYMDEMVQNVTPLYTTPPQRTWVGLTDEELAELSASGLALWSLWRAIEAKLKEKNK
jgi:hypothetical protein